MFVRKQLEFGIDPIFHESNDIHIHVPEGATAERRSICGNNDCNGSCFCAYWAKSTREVGMTGEITLRGRVLPIGGLKEKALSAHRAGLTTIILPSDNERDIEDIPESIREELTFKLVSDSGRSP